MKQTKQKQTCRGREENSGYQRVRNQAGKTKEVMINHICPVETKYLMIILFCTQKYNFVQMKLMQCYKPVASIKNK